MQGRGEKLRQRASACLVLGAIAVGLFCFVGSASQKPVGWGAAYALGTAVTVDLPGSCRIETIGDDGSAKCEGTRWTADGQAHTGTLFASSEDVRRGSDGSLSFTGEAKALGERAYGKPATWLTVFHLAALGVAALCVVALLVSLIAAALPTRRRA